MSPPTAKKRAAAVRYRLLLSAKGLKDADVRGLSDPKCYVSVDDFGRVEELGATGTVRESLNPEWPDAIELEFILGDLRDVVLRVVDVDDGKSREEPLGEARFPIGRLLAGKPIELPLSVKGTIKVVPERVQDNDEHVRMTWRGKKLAGRDGLFGKSDGFVRFRRRVVGDQGASELQTVRETEVIANEKNPEWATVEMSLSELCNCAEDATLVLEVWDADDDGSHDLIGACETTLRELRGSAGKEFGLRRPKDKKDQGKLVLHQVQFYEMPSLTKHVAAGLKLGVHAHVDATASNMMGSNRFHTLGDDKTPYEAAIERVCKVMAPLDDSVTLHMFGAKFDGDGAVSHDKLIGEFPYAELSRRYRDEIRRAELWGPTLLSPLLRNILSRVEDMPRDVFEVHFVFTDGALYDEDGSKKELKQVKRLLRALGRFGVFIVIVGIGGGDGGGVGFGDMEDLDDLDPAERKAGAVDLTDFIKADDHATESSLTMAMFAELGGAVSRGQYRRGIRPADYGQ